jgi:hypothetical protein
VLLHEFTHSLGGGWTNDLKISETGFLARYQGGEVDATGWNRIRRLAKAVPYVDDLRYHANKPDNNADIIAYFAMGKL